MPGSMEGRVCLVTGASAGIGAAAADLLAQRGATVLIHGRDAKRGERVRQRIADRTGNAGLTFIPADFARLGDVRALAARVHALHDRLDVLINNAGLFASRRRVTPEGHELTFAVNHLAPFLLTNLLRDLLEAGSAARIVNVSSSAHRSGRLDLDDLDLARAYNGWRAYAASKLANVLFTRELVRRWTGTHVVANAVHPGVVRTRLGRGRLAGFLWFLKLSMRSPRSGAGPLVRLAADGDVEGVTGRYFDRYREREPSGAALDDAAARRLWDESARRVGWVVA